MIQVKLAEVLSSLNKVDKTKYFPGFKQFTGPDGQITGDNLKEFVTVSTQEPASRVEVNYDVDFVTVATRASDINALTKAAGNTLPAISAAVASPTPGTVVNGLQVIGDQFERIVKTDSAFDNLEFSFSATPVRRNALESYSAQVNVTVVLLLTDISSQLFGPDTEELANVQVLFDAAGLPAEPAVRSHTKAASIQEGLQIPLTVPEIVQESPFSVTTTIITNATTDGQGSGASVSLVRVTKVQIILTAMTPAPVQSATPGQPADGASGPIPGTATSNGHGGVGASVSPGVVTPKSIFVETPGSDAIGLTISDLQSAIGGLRLRSVPIGSVAPASLARNNRDSDAGSDSAVLIVRPIDAVRRDDRPVVLSDAQFDRVLVAIGDAVRSKLDAR